MTHGQGKTNLKADEAKRFTVNLARSCANFIAPSLSHTMKKHITPFLASILCIAGLVAGCVSFNADTYNTEKLAVDTATTATHQFNQYYQSATNAASPADLAKLNSARDQIYSADRDLGKSLAVLDAARLDYAANSADTNKTAVLVAIQTVSDQSSNVVSLVKTFLPQK